MWGMDFTQGLHILSMVFLPFLGIYHCCLCRMFEWEVLGDTVVSSSPLTLWLWWSGKAQLQTSSASALCHLKMNWWIVGCADMHCTTPACASRKSMWPVIDCSLIMVTGNCHLCKTVFFSHTWNKNIKWKNAWSCVRFQFSHLLVSDVLWTTLCLHRVGGEMSLNRQGEILWSYLLRQRAGLNGIFHLCCCTQKNCLICLFL